VLYWLCVRMYGVGYILWLGGYSMLVGMGFKYGGAVCHCGVRFFEALLLGMGIVGVTKWMGATRCGGVCCVFRL